jgi:steroid 5-alpha reductase family enzyme
MASKPVSLPPPLVAVMQAIGRIKKNIAYFRVNYAVCMVACCALSFLFNPTSLIVLALLLLAWGYVMIYRANQKFVISGREIRWGNLFQHTGFAQNVFCFLP